MSDYPLHSPDPSHEPKTRQPLQNEVPLCVDLDGTLIVSDVLWESFIHLWSKPGIFLRALWHLQYGKAAMKGILAENIYIDPESLPYREDLLTFLRAQFAEGRHLVLVTATHRLIAERVADYLGIFSHVMASDGRLNLGGKNKKDALVSVYGEGGYDYIGDHDKDLVIFSSARLALLADPSNNLKKKTSEVAKIDRIFERQKNGFKTILKAMRVHQWSKNILLGVPLITAHKMFDLVACKNLVLAFICFSLLASGTYILNDLHDLTADRKHLKKRFRPLASGNLSIPAGLVLAAVLLAASFSLSLIFLPGLFVVSLIAYSVLTLAYSFDLKQRLIVDLLTLALLYTLRIIAGAMAIDVKLSAWLIMFSLFFFVSLALLKRYIEISQAFGDKKLPGREYMPSDSEIILSMGTSSGLLSVLIFALYINSPSIIMLYKTPQMLWLLCPILIYWITRIWFLAKRGFVHHDPIVFAITDSRSYIAAAFAALIIMLASIDLFKIFDL